MKTIAILFISSSLSFLLFVGANNINNATIEYPENVKQVIDSKCYNCHSDKGQSDDAKEALHWDKLLTLDKADQIATLDEIIEVLEEGTMPPKKAIERFPNLKMSEEEVGTLLDWAETTAENLME